jgi:hypothetical protein
MLRYRTLIALTLGVATPALAGPKTEYGEADGERFEYTVELRAKGLIHFAGVVLNSGERFDLDLRKDGHVEGHFGPSAVEFGVDKKVRDKVAAELGEGTIVADARPVK